jgi:glutamate synthase domain-containing protein 1
VRLREEHRRRRRHPHADAAPVPEECYKIGITLPDPGRYGAGIVFLPRGAKGRAHCEEIWARVAAEEGMPVLGWRDLPTDNAL